MFLFALQKTVALLLMPVGLIWLLLLGAGWLCLRRRAWAPGVILALTALLYAVAGNIHVGAALMARLEAEIPKVAVDDLQPFDAVFVLGGGNDQDPFGRPELSYAGDRIYQGARLWHAGKVRTLVTSGFGMDGVNGLQNAGEETRVLWRGLGVPDQAILVVAEPCWITRDEIAAYRRLSESHGWKRMGLISTASHLPRALALARKAGLEVTPLGADWLGRKHKFLVKSLVPQADGFMLVQRACWEWLGRRAGR